MLAGTLTRPAAARNSYNYFRWYRVVAASELDKNTNNQYVTLAGADWNPNTTSNQAWLFDNLIAVYEKNMRLELPYTKARGYRPQQTTGYRKAKQGRAPASLPGATAGLPSSVA